MMFKVFHKTGELKDAQGNWDGDDGYEETAELSDDTVKYAFA